MSLLTRDDYNLLLQHQNGKSWTRIKAKLNGEWNEQDRALSTGIYLPCQHVHQHEIFSC